MILVSQAHRKAWLEFAGMKMRCAIGRGGIANRKVEGDGITPSGQFPLREIFYRPDRLAPPITKLPTRALYPDDGWCDDPAQPAYNRLVRHPVRGSAERLWRDDQLYDVLAVVGYNDRPVVPGRGSAIFLHIATPDYAPTEGCIALRRADFIKVLAVATRRTRLSISP